MRKILQALALIALSAPAAADEVTTFTLKNGLELVVIEDHRAPVVVHMVWYRAGAADEPKGHSGIAHFLEHLLFKGTDDRAPGEFSQVVEDQGGSDNAFTSWDYTAYYQRVAADRLPLMMEMEADRMRDLVLSEADVKTERDVILEERNQRTDNDPGALFGEQHRAAQYMNQPYGIPVIGWRHEMEKLSLEDALTYYRLYYAPNNAIVVVAGDVKPDEVKALAEQYYGPLEPSEGIVTRERPSEPAQLAERRLRFDDPRVAQPYVMRSYLAPERDAGDQKNAAALTLLAEVLGGNPATSVLGRAMQFDTQTAVYASAYYDGTSYDDTTFGFVVVPADGVTLQQAEDKMDAVVADFLKTGVDTARLDRIKTQVRAEQIYARDNVESLANMYGGALTSGLTVADVQAWPDLLQQVTADDVMAAARDVFDRKRAVTGWLEVQEAAQ